MKFIEFVKTASDHELIKMAEGLRVSLQNIVTDSVVPVMQKLAEEIKEEKNEANSSPSAGVPQGESNLHVAVAENVLDKNAMNEAIKECIYSNNIDGLSKIIQGIAAVHGPELAEAAISIARQIMQDGLVSGKLRPEQLSSLAEAFKAFDGAVDVK